MSADGKRFCAVCLFWPCVTMPFLLGSSAQAFDQRFVGKVVTVMNCVCALARRRRARNWGIVAHRAEARSAALKHRTLIALRLRVLRKVCFHRS